MAHDLPDKRARFIDEYLLCLNKTKAAFRAGYAPEFAGQEGHRLYKNAEIRAEIDRRLAEAGMPSQEAVKRMSDVASTRLNDFFKIESRQGYEQVPMYLSVLVEKKKEEVEFIQEFAGKNGIALAGMEGPTAMGKRLAAAQQELLELELEKLAHGPDAEKLVAGKPIVYEVAELDLVALARADQQGLLKTFKQGKDGISVELCAPDAALRDILRMHGMYEKDNRQLAGTDVEIVIGGEDEAEAQA